MLDPFALLFTLLTLAMYALALGAVLGVLWLIVAYLVAIRYRGRV